MSEEGANRGRGRSINLYVANLPLDISKDVLQKFFNDTFGPVLGQSCRVFQPKADATIQYAYGFVRMEKREDGLTAIEMAAKNKVLIKGVPIHINEKKEVGSGPRPWARTISDDLMLPQQDNLHVDGIATSTTVEQLHQLFRTFGAVQSIKILDGHTAAMVRMQSHQNALAAIAGLDRKPFDGHILLVSLAKNSPNNFSRHKFIRNCQLGTPPRPSVNAQNTIFASVALHPDDAKGSAKTTAAPTALAAQPADAKGSAKTAAAPSSNAQPADGKGQPTAPPTSGGQQTVSPTGTGQQTAPPSGQQTAPPSGQQTAPPSGQQTAPPPGQQTASAAAFGAAPLVGRQTRRTDGGGATDEKAGGRDVMSMLVAALANRPKSYASLVGGAPPTNNLAKKDSPLSGNYVKDEYPPLSGNAKQPAPTLSAPAPTPAAGGPAEVPDSDANADADTDADAGAAVPEGTVGAQAAGAEMKCGRLIGCSEDGKSGMVLTVDWKLVTVRRDDPSGTFILDTTSPTQYTYIQTGAEAPSTATGLLPHGPGYYDSMHDHHYQSSNQFYNAPDGWTHHQSQWPYAGPIGHYSHTWPGPHYAMAAPIGMPLPMPLPAHAPFGPSPNQHA